MAENSPRLPLVAVHVPVMLVFEAGATMVITVPVQSLPWVVNPVPDTPQLPTARQ